MNLKVGFLYFNLFLIHINDKSNPLIKNHIMKKVILILVVGVVLASCSSGWSCKKRYCDVQKKEILKKNILAAKESIVVTKP